MIKNLVLCGALALISAEVSAQEVKRVTIYDSPDHTESHTVTYKEGGYTGHEFSHDLALLDSVRVREPQNLRTERTRERDSLQAIRDSIQAREATLRKLLWPDEF